MQDNTIKRTHHHETNYIIEILLNKHTMYVHNKKNKQQTKNRILLARNKYNQQLNKINTLNEYPIPYISPGQLFC